MLLPNSQAEGEAPDYDPGVTGQYFAPLLASSSPAQAGAQPVKESGAQLRSTPAEAGAQPAKKTRRKAASADADQPDLNAANYVTSVCVLRID